MVRWLLCAALLLLALALGALALGAFASLNSAAPTWMRALGAFESLLLGALPLGSFVRALIEALLSALAVYGAFLPAPRHVAARLMTPPSQP